MTGGPTPGPNCPGNETPGIGSPIGVTKALLFITSIIKATRRGKVINVTSIEVPLPAKAKPKNPLRKFPIPLAAAESLFRQNRQNQAVLN